MSIGAIRLVTCCAGEHARMSGVGDITLKGEFMPFPSLFHRRSRPWTNRHVRLEGATPRVLVVDDNVNGALALAAYLSSEDIECRTAFGGKEAIAVGTAWMPHVILMDISMPECDGFEAARALRQDPRTCAIAIVAHTALDENKVRWQASADEFDGYVQKGRPPGQLIALIKTLAS